MDTIDAAVVPHPPTAAGWSSRVTIACAALLAFVFFVAIALPYLTLDPAVLTQYSSRRAWVLVHVGLGAVALLTGPVQLWFGLHRRAMRLHRRLGLLYVASVGLSSVAAFYLATQTTLGWGFGSGIASLGVACVVTTTMAVIAIRRGLIQQHQEWMIRSYVMTFAFVMFRIMLAGLQAAEIGTRQEQFAASSWFCWAVPLLINEAVLQGRKIFGAHHAGAWQTE